MLSKDPPFKKKKQFWLPLPSLYFRLAPFWVCLSCLLYLHPFICKFPLSCTMYIEVTGLWHTTETFFFFFCTSLFLHLVGNLGLPDLGKATATTRAESYPILPLCAVLSFVHTMGCLPVSGMFNPCSEADACSCVQDLCERHQRVCADGWLLEKNPLLHQWIKHVSYAPDFSVPVSTEVSCQVASHHHSEHG